MSRAYDRFTPYRFISLAAQLFHPCTDCFEIIGRAMMGKDNHGATHSRRRKDQTVRPAPRAAPLLPPDGPARPIRVKMRGRFAGEHHPPARHRDRAPGLVAD